MVSVVSSAWMLEIAESAGIRGVPSESSAQRSMEYVTSRISTGSPLWNCTPSRRVKVYVV